MNYTDLSESQKAQLMDVAVKFIVSTVDGFCANESDANKQEYALRLLLHLKSHVDHMLKEDRKRDDFRSIEDKISEWKQKLEQASQYDMFLDSGAAVEMLETIEEQQKEIEHWKKGFENENVIAGKLQRKVERLEKEIEHLRIVEQAYEALKLAKS